MTSAGEQSLDGLADLALELASSLDSREVIERTLRRAIDVIQADRATLSSVEDDGLSIEATVGAGGDVTWIGRHYEMDYLANQPLVAEAIATQTPVVGGRLDAERAAPEFREALQAVRHTAVIPLTVAGEVVGLVVLSRADDPGFDPARTEALRVIGGIAGMALNNARLHTETVTARRAAQEAATHLEAAHAAKSDLMDYAVHEMRGPLAVALGYVSMARDGSLGELADAMIQPLAIVEAKLGEALSIAEEMLTLARIEGGTLPVVTERVDLVALVHEVTHTASAESPDARIDVVVGAGATFAIADHDRTRLIISNLVGNALKYSREHPQIVITISGSGAMVNVSVRDSGSGVDEADRGRIFDRFQRGNDERHRAVPGTGLGLYISRAFARRMDGDVELTASEPGVGSTFVLSLHAALAT